MGSHGAGDRTLAGLIPKDDRESPAAWGFLLWVLAAINGYSCQMTSPLAVVLLRVCGHDTI